MSSARGWHRWTLRSAQRCMACSRRLKRSIDGPRGASRLKPTVIGAGVDFVQLADNIVLARPAHSPVYSPGEQEAPASRGQPDQAKAAELNHSYP